MSPAKRKPGRPPRGTPAVTPLTLATIARLHLRGKSSREIGVAVGLDNTTVCYHLHKTIIPGWEKERKEALGTELAKVRHLEAVAWDCFEKALKPETRRQIEKALVEGGTDLAVVKRVLTRTDQRGQNAWLQVVQWCIDWRAKVFGSYSPEKHEISDDFRAAGLTQEELLRDIQRRLKARIAEKKAAQEQEPA